VNTFFLSLIALFLITLSSCSPISNSPAIQLRGPSTGHPTIEPTDEVIVTSTSNVIITKTATIIPISSPTMKVTPSPSVTVTPVTPTETPVPKYFYTLQPDSPIGMTNFIQPEKACNWSGVGGQVFSKEGNPVLNLVIQISGTLDGKDIDALGLTGTNQAFGTGGYSIQLADHLVESHSTLYIQIFDLKGTPLTEKYYFDTYNDCQENLLIINFVDSSIVDANFIYLPNVKQ
jgi:hypothetical protein